MIFADHQDETNCILLAKESVSWSRISNDIHEIVNNCKYAIDINQLKNYLFYNLISHADTG